MALVELSAVIVPKLSTSESKIPTADSTTRRKDKEASTNIGTMQASFSACVNNF